MSELIPVSGEDVQCSECKVIFSVAWHRHTFYNRVEYCPFCGEDFYENRRPSPEADDHSNHGLY